MQQQQNPLFEVLHRIFILNMAARARCQFDTALHLQLHLGPFRSMMRQIIMEPPRQNRSGASGHRQEPPNFYPRLLAIKRFFVAQNSRYMFGLRTHLAG
jgi:hypothetical protein